MSDCETTKQLDQRRAPVAEAMKAYARDGALAFHTPGHKQGLGAHPLLRELITPEGLREEVSLMEELDDLHEPTMCIREAEALAAELYGADAAWFMINGTSGAIHTMLMGTLHPGDVVLVPRNAHRSLVGGIILAGARPIYIQPVTDARLGIAMGLRLADIEAASKDRINTPVTQSPATAMWFCTLLFISRPPSLVQNGESAESSLMRAAAAQRPSGTRRSPRQTQMAYCPSLRRYCS